MAKRDGGFHVYRPKVTVKYCIPLLVSPLDAYDVGVRITPEMEKDPRCPGPGFNIKGDKLNEEGKPSRDQWVVRTATEGHVHNAQAKLLDVLRLRADRGGEDEKVRLAMVLGKRGFSAEAEPLRKELYESAKRRLGPEH